MDDTTSLPPEPEVIDNKKSLYETMEEATMRLKDSIVMYDKKPHWVITAADSHPDGVLRLYLVPYDKNLDYWFSHNTAPCSWFNEGELTRRVKMDAYIKANPIFGIIRKRINSSKFNSFRPFPLGMMKLSKDAVFYAQRAPVRHTYQGLKFSAIMGYHFSGENLVENPTPTRIDRVSRVYSKGMEDMFLGLYPSYEEVLEKFASGEATAPLNRDFCLIRGPLNIKYLAYQCSIVGVLPDSRTVQVPLDRAYLTEVISGLNIFQEILVSN